MPLNIDFQQILLHMLNLVLLFGILYFLLYKPVKNFIDKRAEHYKDMDEQAEKKLAEAGQTKAELESKLANVSEEIEEKRQKAMEELSRESEEQLRQAREEAERIRASARAEAQKEHDKIISGAESEISAMVAEAAEKLVYASTGEAYDEFLKAAERSGEDE